ncbi:hypothetical protein N0V83_001797 [Neocucurbitaria cava]|uniref:GST N-terminal domain-containing protein n=1 Tax=Neocucurbitaria cava TaxID=798079 RepID=A0A9W9CQ73_9PLEO|nr:hypothetical protein N0V83_001797 [Neocucurbitaria cava]
MTIWIWPIGLFPRRIINYFRAKNITTSILKAHDIHLIPVTLDPSVGLVSLPGYETRPTDISLPCLRIEKADGEVFWIHETLAILSYFEEELFSVERGYTRLEGEGAEQRAKVRDLVGQTTDASTWGAIGLMNSDVSTTSWSGLKEEEMHADTAVHARKKFDGILTKIEGWVEPDVIGRGTQSLAGKGADVTFADIFLAAQVDYMQWVYGVKWLQGHEVLEMWYERVKEEKWRVGNEVLASADGSDGWEGLLGR